jgi:hypothetical protein
VAKRVLDKTPYMAQRVEPSKRNGMVAGASTSRTNPAIGATMPRGSGKGRGGGVPLARTTTPARPTGKFVLVERKDVETLVTVLAGLPNAAQLLFLVESLRQALRDG